MVLIEENNNVKDVYIEYQRPLVNKNDQTKLLLDLSWKEMGVLNNIVKKNILERF